MSIWNGNETTVLNIAFYMRMAEYFLVSHCMHRNSSVKRIKKSKLEITLKYCAWSGGT